MLDPAPLVLAITGASGACYGLRAIERWVQAERPLHLIVSDAGRRVAREELDLRYDAESLRARLGEGADRVRLHPVRDIGATVASGSVPSAGMVVAPCSLGTAARIAGGLSSNLIERAADVHLKERRPLVLVVRETPLSTLHLENLLRLSRAGAIILPAAPGFYHRPSEVADLVDFVVDRALRIVGLEPSGAHQWDGGASE